MEAVLEEEGKQWINSIGRTVGDEVEREPSTTNSFESNMEINGVVK